MVADPPKTIGIRNAAMIAAEQELDEAIKAADREMRRVDVDMANMAKQSRPLTDKEVQGLADMASGPNAPRQWESVRARIARGEFTWRDVAEGRMASDPQVSAALHASIAVKPEPARPAQARRELVFGEPDPEPYVRPQARPARPRPVRRSGEGDDEDFSETNYMR